MKINYICNDCDKTYDSNTLVFQCECGGMLDLEEFDISLSVNNLLKNENSLFKYLGALPFDKDSTFWKDISMGEGLTPIIRFDIDNPNLLVKVDYLMPTLSFKDRGAVMLIAKAKEIGINKVVQDSSGNGGSSVAAYASRAGMECDIYVPDNTSPKKIKQISSYGANVHVVAGSREDTAKAAIAVAKEGNSFYASHVYNPFFYQGTKTYVYEIYEQLGGEMPEALVIPLGNGTLVLGAYYGLKDLLKLGLITELPKIIAVQSQNCAPIYKAFKDGEDSVIEVSNTGTLAEGIAIADPKRGKQVLKAIRETKGDIILSPEEEITNVMELLAHKGFYVEPTTAATFAGYFKYINNSSNPIKGKVVIPLCGSGLKS